MNHVSDPGRHDGTTRCWRTGRSGLGLPLPSLGHRHDSGDGRPFRTRRKLAPRALGPGITHRGPANDYGPPYGAAEADTGPGHALRDRRVTSLVIGASRTEQLEQNGAALEKPGFDGEEPAGIDTYATGGGVGLRRGARLGTPGRTGGAVRGVRGRGRGTAVR
ncbi:hypothetical protein [Streptomyces sp. NPDC016626]|uniref:hypothetical protein n=1 Tax=Streptomyces sp. NPDC016626 TaxID=3364968 RepID=UPI0036F50895